LDHLTRQDNERRAATAQEKVIFESERVQLRSLTPDDAEAIVSDTRTGRSWAPDYPTPGDVRIAAFALAGHTAFATDAMPWGLFVVVDRPSGLVVGGIGFKGAPNERGEVEIGYGICESFQGRGVATEAVIAMCVLARRGARVVIAETDRANAASQRVLEKGGFLSDNADDELIRWRKQVSNDERHVVS
jgi:RimJ/RimL family protein N-acetyltransferase